MRILILLVLFVSACSFDFEPVNDASYDAGVLVDSGFSADSGSFNSDSGTNSDSAVLVLDSGTDSATATDSGSDSGPLNEDAGTEPDSGFFVPCDVGSRVDWSITNLGSCDGSMVVTSTIISYEGNCGASGPVTGTGSNPSVRTFAFNDMEPGEAEYNVFVLWDTGFSSRNIYCSVFRDSANSWSGECWSTAPGFETWSCEANISRVL